MKKRIFKDKKRNKGDLFTYLMKNYIVSFVVTAICIVFVIIMAMKISFDKTFELLTEVEKQKNTIVLGEFEKLNIPMLAGEKGGIKIFDSDRKLVFQGGTVKDKELILSELQQINGSFQYVTKKDYEYKDGRRVTLITKELWDETDGGWFVIIDENRKALNYSENFPWKKGVFSQEDIWNITNNYKMTEDEYKYEFITTEGKEYTMVIFLGRDIFDYNEKIQNIIRYIPLIILFVFIVCTLIFLLILSRNIKKPINELNDAMKAYSKGERVSCIMSRAPKEFLKINDTFNSMVEKIREIEEKEKQYMMEKQRIIADISHDLKTPITIINGYAKALEDGKIREGDEQKYLSIIRSKSTDLTNLINMFHEYSKMEHPEYNLTLKKINFSEMVRSYIAEIYNYVYDLGFILEIEIEDDDIYYEVDELQMRRAIWNIVSNALKYNPKGTSIRIGLFEDKGTINFQIGDNGVGIEENVRNQIFDAFVIGDDARSPKHGTGLGLAITKKIIKKHGGRIDFTCEGEYKTNFIMKF